ncbi:MAG: PD40 domain-containing protein, partial [Flavisolibacter sp.]|nr:PD40 domain-containing protein [Flavisolibacter sp.]
EYMSIGSVDANTAIWLRSSLLSNKLPTIKDLTNKPNEYFPYRWGQAFWSYVTGLWGDTIIRRLFIETGKRGYEDAFKRVLKMDVKLFSERWKESIKNSYSPYMATTNTTGFGRSLITKKNAGELNIVPSISPDGKLVAFWTEKNLFSIDLYLADAATGRIVERLTSTSLASHIDEYSSFESSVAWSPDSRQVAFVAFAKGRNQLVIVDTKGKIQQQIDVPGVPSISNPTWSPDSHTIVLTGMVDGQSDLYSFDLNSKKVRQLTNDRFSDIQPSFSPDGKRIVFATDRVSIGSHYIQHSFAHNLALLDVKTGSITNLDVFAGADNLNPVFARDNNTIYFLSDRDGFRNLYSYEIPNKQVYQLTNLFTGITGITAYSPAISAARQTDQVVYSYYANNDYLIYTAQSTEFERKAVNDGAINKQAATLPPFNRIGVSLVQRNLESTPFGLVAENTLTEVPYRPKFQLDYIGNTGMGVSTSRFGTGLAGGVNGIFSDILGNNQLFGAVALNGEIYDLGGQFAYINQKGRINWGITTSHIPYLSGYQYMGLDKLPTRSGDTLDVINSATDLLRTFEDQVSGFIAYPFSPIRRIEAGASAARYYYRLDRYSDYYTYVDPNNPYTYNYVGNKREKLPTPSGFNFGQAYLALVGDNSYFGVAAPLAGHRFRLEASKYVGAVNLQTITGDYRKYFRLAPVTLATRNMYVGRFGKDAQSGVLPPLFLGYPGLVRGYEARNFARSGSRQSLNLNDLVGSRIYVGNAELRFPLSGPERLSVIKSKFFFADLNLFTDGGIAWGNSELIGYDKPATSTFSRNSRVIVSSGVSMRVNLFGYLVIEPYLAAPWQNGGLKNLNFGLNFLPGW